MDRKGEINQIFVYALSIIVIAFVGFLVIKFISGFTDTVEERVDTKIFKELEKDHLTVYRTYGSEKVYDYKISSSLENMCFISEISCIDSLSSEDFSEEDKEGLRTVVSAGDNVATFTKLGLDGSSNIGEFSIDGDGCLCFQPKNSRFEMIFENRRNEVFLTLN